MCSRTRENNKNKVGQVIWDTLYLLVASRHWSQREKLLWPLPSIHNLISEQCCGCLSDDALFPNVTEFQISSSRKWGHWTNWTIFLLEGLIQSWNVSNKIMGDLSVFGILDMCCVFYFIRLCSPIISYQVLSMYHRILWVYWTLLMTLVFSRLGKEWMERR